MPTTIFLKRRAGRAAAFMAALACLAGAVGADAAGFGTGTNSRLVPPASRLGRAPDEAPVVCATGGVGGVFGHDQGRPAIGGALVFRPAAAANFLDFLYDWNTGLVLQGERLSLAGGGRVASADLILRRYRRCAAGGEGSVPFWGAGIGASSAAGSETGATPYLKYWSLVAECGQEWRHANGRLLLVKAQFRSFRKGGADYSGWTVMAGAGVPLPF